MKPVIAITIGDPAGIGPEVVLKSLQQKEVYDHCLPLVIGDAQILSLQNYGVSLKIRPILNPLEAKYQRGTLDVLHVPCEDYKKLKFGQPNIVSGALSLFCVKKSVELALNKIVHGVVHAPISKKAWALAGVRFSGHTELIAAECGIKKFAMAIASEPLRTVLATRHISLKEVSKHLTKSAVSAAIFLAFDWMKQKKILKPKIGICALNPHAGEKGLLGQEEIEIIGPAIKEAKNKIEAELFGPLPADSAFKDHKQKKYDCLVTMYHDQSLIPLKLFSAEKLVNITLGLPFPRTSPGHGTATDIAGKKRADPRPMVQAILTAAELT
ncbi:MAG: 4-hydroxythreonine-4-phosphate dehydrogenase PdxA [Elusimicrobia bacterium]|nr:4-hydroxythreonine-4-phosphate dehydrogenase PdxA [Elusimicrobiota bacterium]